MQIKIFNQIINTANIVEANFEPACVFPGEDDGEESYTSPSILRLTMSSISGQEVTTYEGDVVAAYSESDVIVLKDQAAEDVWAYLSAFSTNVDGFAEAMKKAGQIDEVKK